MFETFRTDNSSLSPPAVYPDSFSRFKLAAAFVIVPALAFQFTPSWVWGRLITGSFGLALWARTPMIRAAKELMARIPNWKELLDLRNSLLSNTPTNAQLTLHLLRVAEDLNEPLPAPPAPPTEGAPEAALNDPTPVGGEAKPGTEGETSQTKKQGKKVKHLLGGAFKKASRKIAGFKGDVSVDNKTKKVSSYAVVFLTRSPRAGSKNISSTANLVPTRQMRTLVNLTARPGTLSSIRLNAAWRGYRSNLARPSRRIFGTATILSSSKKIMSACLVWPLAGSAAPTSTV